MKTGRITCTTTEELSEGKTKKHRQSFSTGFTANISHSGDDSAVAVRSVLDIDSADPKDAILCRKWLLLDAIL